LQHNKSERGAELATENDIFGSLEVGRVLGEAVGSGEQGKRDGEKGGAKNLHLPGLRGVALQSKSEKRARDAGPFPGELLLLRDGCADK
jgi:hypothetical protein